MITDKVIFKFEILIVVKFYVDQINVHMRMPCFLMLGHTCVLFNICCLPAIVGSNICVE